MTTRAGAWLGLASAGVALGVAHLVAAFVGGASSPIVAVGSASIDRTPEWLKSFAIRTFGDRDKLMLLVGIGVVVALLAIALGIASLRRPRTGLVGLAVLGAVGALAALTHPGATDRQQPIRLRKCLAGRRKRIGALVARQPEQRPHALRMVHTSISLSSRDACRYGTCSPISSM